jgi:hypothetical protein
LRQQHIHERHMQNRQNEVGSVHRRATIPLESVLQSSSQTPAVVWERNGPPRPAGILTYASRARGVMADAADPFADDLGAQVPAAAPTAGAPSPAAPVAAEVDTVGDNPFGAPASPSTASPAQTPEATPAAGANENPFDSPF